jgi:hypothetical protein
LAIDHADLARVAACRKDVAGGRPCWGCAVKSHCSTPKTSGLSSRRIALLLKHHLENGQDVCQATIDDTDCDALIEREALKLTIGAVKPVAHWPVRIAIFVHGGNVQDVYANANVEGVATPL